MIFETKFYIGIFDSMCREFPLERKLIYFDIKPGLILTNKNKIEWDVTINVDWSKVGYCDKFIVFEEKVPILKFKITTNFLATNCTILQINPGSLNFNIIPDHNFDEFYINQVLL